MVARETTIPVAEADPEEVLVKRYGRLGPLLSKLFASGVEARGVERVPEDQRETKNMWNKCVHVPFLPLTRWLKHLHPAPSLLMWWSVNTVLTTIPIGTLAQEYYTLTLPFVLPCLACVAPVTERDSQAYRRYNPVLRSARRHRHSVHQHSGAQDGLADDDY